MEPLDLALKHSISGRFDEAEAILRSLPQNDARVRFNLGWFDMTHGKLMEGFEGVNCGRFINVFGSPKIQGTIWKDQDLTNKILLLRGEGGLGDEIINFRFAQEFKKLGANVVVSGHPALLPIFSRHGFVCVTSSAVEKGEVYYDYWVPAMSASYVLGYEYDTLPGNPYLNAVPESVAKKPGTIKVGLRWSGNPHFEHEQHRTFDPKLMIDLHNTPGVTCYSFQKDHNLVDNLPFDDLGTSLKTWEDTASHLKSMDLVITSCTSVAHMSAALGIETWVIVPILPYYVWAVPGDKSAWYNSVRLFRQEKYGDWSAPFAEIQKCLNEKVKLKVAA
jgi:hypothetical protein